MSGYPRMNEFEVTDEMLHQHRITELRDKYVKGTATAEEVDEFWAEILKDPKQLEQLKAEANLKSVFKKLRANDIRLPCSGQKQGG